MGILKNNTKLHQKGLTLLEVLISMLVLSIGLFGLAGLQSSSLRANNSANHRTIASMLAADILDRMRANPTQLASDGYEITSRNAYPIDSAIIGRCKNVGTGECTPADLKEYDLNQWIDNTFKLKQLPNATGGITIDTVNASTKTYRVLISITWDDFSAASGGLGGRGSENFSYTSIVKL